MEKNVYKEVLLNKVLFNFLGVKNAAEMVNLTTDQLRTYANDLNRKLKANQDDLFAEKTVAQSTDQLRLEFVLDIIKTRDEEQKAKLMDSALRREKAEHAALLKQIKAERANQALTKLSDEEIDRRLKELE